MSRFTLFCLVVVAVLSLSHADSSTVEVDWDSQVAVSRTITTLQVVSNPILDRVFSNGKVNPIHDNAFTSLKNLQAEMVRFVPWFPYPWTAVAELKQPTSTSTSWNFDYVLPQFEDFMHATSDEGHTTVINFSTQPCWLFKNTDCSFPSNPDESDFGYVRGTELVDSTATDLAMYYARLISYFKNGYMVDEHGVNHTAARTFNLTYWEVFNEAEHGYTQEQYTHDYDVLVAKVRELADPQHTIKWVGIGGADPAWIPYFLNTSNHVLGEGKNTPLDFVSTHFYAGTSNRTDTTTYGPSFFAAADGFISSVRTTLLPARDKSSSPTTKLDFDELGVIMPGDNDPGHGIDADLPGLYWNAAGSMYAYLFGNFVVDGIDVLGHSQLAGSPEIPDWGIPLPQYPSVSLLSWKTGFGNARYWVLRLLIVHFAPGDRIVKTTVLTPPTPPAPGTDPFCAESVGEVYPPVFLQCNDPAAVITNIAFADWGTPQGSCPNYSISQACSTASQAAQWASDLCLGNNSCTLAPYPALGDPCVGTVKRLAVLVHCSGTQGGHSSSVPSAPVFALAVRKADGAKKILVLNKTDQPQTVVLPAGGVLWLVDPTSVQDSAEQGIRADSVPASGVFTLQPFAVGVLVY